MTHSVASLAMITLDCDDPAKAAAFWSGVLGWELTHSGEDYAMLSGPSHVLGFGRVAGYQPPHWPNERGSKQFHLDLAVPDVAAAEARCVELGARVPDHQPGETWRVLLDPSGHPFCLTDAANWG